MLAITYKNNSKVLTGWTGDEQTFDDIKYPADEAVAILDIPIPVKSANAWLFDEITKTLIAKPAYIEPLLARDLAKEIDGLKAEIKSLKEAR